MIGNVDVAEVVFELFGLHLVEVLVEVVVLLTDSLGVAHVRLKEVLDLDFFKAKSVVPVAQELKVLLFAEEGRGHELVAPERHVVFGQSAFGVLLVVVADHILVVGGQLERPNVVFFEAVVDGEHVGVRGVRVERLTLEVVEAEELIIVMVGNDWRCADNVLFLCRQELHTLEVVGFKQVVIIDVVLEVAVILGVFVEAREVGVEEGAGYLASDQSVEAHLETIVDLEVLVLMHAFVVPSGAVSAAQTSLLSVLMDAP